MALLVAATTWFQWGRGERSGPIRLLGDDPLIYVYESGEEEPEALGSRLRVTYDADSRCLYVLDRRGDRSLAIWPRGSESILRDGRRGVRVPGAGMILAGDAITAASVDAVSVQDGTRVAEALAKLGACLPPSGSVVLFYRIDQVEGA